MQPQGNFERERTPHAWTVELWDVRAYEQGQLLPSRALEANGAALALMPTLLVALFLEDPEAEGGAPRPTAGEEVTPPVLRYAPSEAKVPVVVSDPSLL